MEGCDLSFMLEEEFRAFTIDDQTLYNAYHTLSGSRLSDMCFNSRIAWEPGFHYRHAVVEGAFCLISDGGVFTIPHMVMPLGTYGPDGLAAILDKVLPIFEARGWPMTMMYIDESKLPVVQSLESRGFTVRTSCNPDFSDYLYDGESLRSLTGKALHAKRNHMNRFLRDYPDYDYKRIEASDGPACLSIVREWCEEKEIDRFDLRLSDYVPIQRIFEHFDRLDVRGGVIRMGDSVHAFALGSMLPDGGAVIHFEKADYRFNGLYAVINNTVLCMEFPDAVQVNREEDMGMEGLRKAKQSYMPIAMADKYNATVCRAG
ncbi:MAG TPA: phosphatidylglycerol lysyltransferase domain-containing protein [Clostridia bacterium]